jgi:hypothetical protein
LSTRAHPQAETPFEKRSREALKKHKDKEIAKVLESKKKEARMMLSKITPVLSSIEAIESLAEFSMLSPQLREPLMAKKEFLDTNAAAAAAIIASDDVGDLPAMASSSGVLEAIADAKKVVARITNVLAAIARLHH